MSTLHKSENFYDVQSTESQEDLTISNPYVQMPSPSTAPQKEKTFTFSAPQTLSEQSSPDPVFDDPAYATGYKPPPPPKPKTPRYEGTLQLSLVPRPLQDFISQSWRKIGRRPATSWTGNGGLG